MDKRDAFRLYDGPAPGTEHWTHDEQAYFTEIFGTNVITNVVTPTLTPVLPEHGNGTAIVIAPGGGYHSLSIDREGFDVARWLTERGVAAFVLKYRLVPCEGDAVRALIEKMVAGTAETDMNEIAPFAAHDGMTAVRLVRDRSAEFGVDPAKVGFIGFSAGANVAARVVLGAEPDSRPDFTAAIYVPLRGIESLEPPSGAGPLFLAAATDDDLGLAPDSIDLYRAWYDADLPVELHLYANGGHGFGMGRQGLPSDGWIERYGDWLSAAGLL